MKIRANQIEIEVEDSAFGDPQAQQLPVVLLIMGLGMQLIAWPPQLVQALVDAGYRVLRMDNRDVGLSSKMGHLGRPSMMWSLIKLRMGLAVRPPYTVSDMAADAAGVLDTLGVSRAHVVGVSMGGMIAQRLAVAHRERVLSLTSIMSSSGDSRLPGPQPHILRMMLSRPDNSSEQAQLEHYVRLFRAIGSPAFPIADAELKERILRGVQRSVYPQGTARQMLAVAADADRARTLDQIHAPTLVVHGRADPLVPFACGEDTARRIAGAQLLAIEGMGHDLPAEPVARIVEAMITHLRSADRLGAQP